MISSRLIHRISASRGFRPRPLRPSLSSNSAVFSHAPLFAQIVSLQEKGDDAAAKRLVSRNAGRLGVELTKVLEEIDRTLTT